DRFLTEEMIDAINLALAQYLQDLGIERPSGVEVMAERLLDHDAAPSALALLDQACGAEMGDRAGEHAVGDRQVEQVIARGAAVLVECGETAAEPAVRLLI